MLGRFLEISVHAPDILESLAFYERLGFTQARTGEIWQHPYGVVTDGRVAIGLHHYEFASPSLTFVQPDLAQEIRALDQLGIEFAFRREGADVFNEAGFTDPNGQMITLLEARTFSPSERREHEQSRLGWFDEYAVPVRDLDASRRFWEAIGFVTAAEEEDPFPRVALTRDGLNLALVRIKDFDEPALVYTDAAMADRISRLAEAGCAFSDELPRRLDPERNALLVAPEGTHLLLLTTDE